MVRNRGLLVTDVRYGIQFDPERSTDFDGAQERIMAYVQRREEELARKAAASRFDGPAELAG